MTVRHLIRMTNFLDVSDVCGCKGLKEVCEIMLADTNLPEILVEPVLHAWHLASGFSGSAEAIRAAVSLAQTVTSDANIAVTTQFNQAQALDTSMENVVLPGEEEDEMDQSEQVKILSSFRSLQILSWSLQQNIGARDSVQGVELYAEMLPFIMECLVEPNSDLRGVSVHCLGLIALTSQEKCQEVHEIVMQVARNESEENEVRCCALEALVDIATIYEERFKDDMVLTNFLVRLQECSEPALARIGAESAAKLLFSGRLSEPKLFANLVKFFFLPEISGNPVTLGDDEENDEEGGVHIAPDEAFFGSAARLQQILSVFFQAFFVAGNGREAIAIDSTSDLVADLALLVRGREIEPIAMAKVF